MFKSVDEQLKIIKRGVLEIVREEELIEKELRKMERDEEMYEQEPEDRLELREVRKERRYNEDDFV